MSDTKTPGNIAYEAYRAIIMPARGLPDGGLPWEWQNDHEQAAWEAAAQSVLAQWMPQQEDTR
jgi:hypothetical protein